MTSEPKSTFQYHERVSGIIGETGRVTTRIARQHDAEVFVRLAKSYNAPELSVSVNRWGAYRVTVRRWTGERFETTEIATGDLAVTEEASQS